MLKNRNITLGTYQDTMRAVKECGTDLIKFGQYVALTIDKYTPKQVDKFSVTQLEEFATDYLSMIEKTNSKLKEVIKINGVLYGFDPCIEEMESGAYCDICDLTKNIEEGDNMAKIMAIFYRPIVKNSIFAKRAYNITSYVDEDKRVYDARVELFKNEMRANEFIGVLDFFLTGQND